MKETLKRRLQRFVDDERGVSPVVGFVLIFALVMIVFTLYQSSVVPHQNKEAEYQHSQTVEGQMEKLDAAVMSAGSDFVSQGVPIQLGVQYPNRAFAINPGTPVGGLETSGNHTITIAGESGSATLNTSFITYRPNYNVYTEETNYSIEDGMLVKEYSNSDNTRLASEDTLFPANDSKVNLPLITGDISKHQMSVVISPSSVVTHPVEITSKSGKLTLPTTLSKESWTEILSEKSQAKGWSYSNSSSGVNQISIELKNGTSIMANKVAAGEYNSNEEDDLGLEPRITNVTPLHPEVEPLNSKTQLTVRTTDIFGGDYSGVDVEITKVNGSGNLSKTTATSDGDGNVTFAYDPVAADSGSTVGITAELANASGDNSSVTFGLEYPSASGPSRCNLGAELESPGLYSSEPEQLNFEITPSSSVSIEKFSVITANDLNDVKKSRSPHEFAIKDGGSEILSYSTNSQTTPIIFNDSNEYRFNSGPTTVNTSTVYIDMFDDVDDEDGEDDQDVKFESLDSSCKDADVIVSFILEDGTERPVFIDATVGDDDDG